MPVDMLKVGDFASFRGHRIQVHLIDRWWKVTEIDDRTAYLVDRTGATARVRRTERYQHLRAIKWERGDNRDDASA